MNVTVRLRRRCRQTANDLICAIRGHVINDRSTGCYKCKRCRRSVQYPACRVDRLG